MDTLSAIQSRASAAKLGEPAPTREHLEAILRAGLRAPDHGRLRPWRYIVLQGAARERLGTAMVEIMRGKIPDATVDQIEAERGKARRAPTIIVAAAKITRGKIPEIEQVAAVAAGVQNMFLAAHALGYGAMWKTGAAAYATSVKHMLGLSAEDHIVGFFYVGTVVAPGTATLPQLEPAVTWLDSRD